MALPAEEHGISSELRHRHAGSHSRGSPMKTKAVRLLAAFVALATFAACSSSKKTAAGGSTATTTATSSAPAVDLVPAGGWKDPASSASRPKIAVRITGPIVVAGTTPNDSCYRAQ